MNEEQADDLLLVLREIRDALKKQTLFDANERLKAAFPDELIIEERDGKKVPVNVGAQQRKKAIHALYPMF